MGRQNILNLMIANIPGNESALHISLPDVSICTRSLNINIYAKKCLIKPICKQTIQITWKHISRRHFLFMWQGLCSLSSKVCSSRPAARLVYFNIPMKLIAGKQLALNCVGYQGSHHSQLFTCGLLNKNM